MTTAAMNDWNDPPRCHYCGNFHATICPKIKSIEYDGGNIKRVEFFAPADYPPMKFEQK